MKMLGRALVASRYAVLLAVLVTLAASLTLLVHEVLFVAAAIVRTVREGTVSAEGGKALAVGLIEAVDVFLIAIGVFIISLGLYALFIDDTLPLPRWLEVHDLDDLKNHLVSVVIAVLAVLFLREAVAWTGGQDILWFGAALAFVIAAFTFFLRRASGDKD